MTVNPKPPLLPAVAGRRCVVTGGLGFIGSNVARAAVASGAAHVLVVDALVEGHGGDRRNLEGLAAVGDASPDPAVATVAPPAALPVDIVVCSVDDRERLAPLLDGAEVVFNLAGQVSHHASMVDPVRDLDLNARSHLGLLETLRAVAPDAAIVYSSTRQVYGRPRYLPVDENHPTAPVDVNGIAKLAGEQAHLLYAAVHDMRISALRLTNVYGPRQDLRHSGLGFLPVFVRQALSGGVIELFGGGSQERDCLHVDDVVRALGLAIATPDAAGELFNLGHPEVRSLAEIAATIVDAAGDGEIRSIAWPDELERIDIGSFHGDFSKAKRVLGWEPEIGLDAGVRSTIEFYREHPWYLSST